MKTPTQTTDNLIKGCRIVYNLGWENERICGEKDFLCPNCKAKLNAYLDAYKNELEFLENSEFGIDENDLSYGNRISELKECCKKIEVAIK